MQYSELDTDESHHFGIFTNHVHVLYNVKRLLFCLFVASQRNQIDEKDPCKGDPELPLKSETV